MGDEAADERLEEESDALPTTVTVENHNFLDATIYVVSGPRRQRLGFVTGLTTQIFTIPEAFIFGSTGLWFEVRQLPRYQLPNSDQVSAFPGDQVFLRIPPS